MNTLEVSLEAKLGLAMVTGKHVSSDNEDRYLLC